MTFNVGERVRWKDDGAYLRLTFPGEETGTVVCVHEHPDQEGRMRLDIRFDNGEVMRGVADHRFERIALYDAPPGTGERSLSSGPAL